MKGQRSRVQWREYKCLEVLHCLWGMSCYYDDRLELTRFSSFLWKSVEKEARLVFWSHKPYNSIIHTLWVIGCHGNTRTWVSKVTSLSAVEAHCWGRGPLNVIDTGRWVHNEATVRWLTGYKGRRHHRRCRGQPILERYISHSPIVSCGRAGWMNDLMMLGTVRGGDSNNSHGNGVVRQEDRTNDPVVSSGTSTSWGSNADNIRIPTAS